MESLGQETKLNALQKSFLKHGGAQCGFCTPGILMGASRTNPAGREDIRQAMAGHLCRCTGYQQIVDSIAHAKGEKK